MCLTQNVHWQGIVLERHNFLRLVVKDNRLILNCSLSERRRIHNHIIAFKLLLFVNLCFQIGFGFHAPDWLEAVISLVRIGVFQDGQRDHLCLHNVSAFAVGAASRGDAYETGLQFGQRLGQS